MQCTVLLALLLLAELAVCSHAVQDFRVDALRVEAIKAEAMRTEASRAERSGTKSARASAESSTELSYASEAAFRASALAHASMFGHAFFDLDAVLDGESRMYGHAGMFGEAAGGSTVIGGSEKSDLEPETAEGSAVIEGSEELDSSGAGAEDDGDVAGAEGNSETNPWDPTRPVGTTLSPEQRVLAHQSKFAAEFTVELNMTEAHETGERMGIILNRDADFMPATVWRINKVGLIEAWNKAHPDMAVHVGDEIIRVNDIQWHANTETFISRIVGQFQAGRKQKDGASDMLKLYIQRPRVWEHARFAGQREDAHNKDYAAEFVACVTMPDEFDDTMEKIMGWNLVRQHGPTGLEEWKPVIIKTIDRLGPVERWNKEHPDRLILEGDEILQLDSIRFHHNATQWLKTLQKHYRSAALVESTNRSALIYIRRPRQNQEEFDSTHPVREVVTWRRPKHSVQITFPQAGIGNLMGWQLVPGKESDSGNSATIIKKVRPGGLADTINAEHPEAIAVGDLIVEIDGHPWEMYDKAADYYAVVDEKLKEAAKKGPESEPVNLVLERPSRLVREVRMNMERGVHMDAKILKHYRELRTTSTTELPPMLPVMFGSDPNNDTSAVEATGATNGMDTTSKDEIIGASDDDDSDVVGAREDTP